jgi:hypothetical protein
MASMSTAALEPERDCDKHGIPGTKGFEEKLELQENADGARKFGVRSATFDIYLAEVAAWGTLSVVWRINACLWLVI